MHRHGGQDRPQGVTLGNAAVLGCRTPEHGYWSSIVGRPKATGKGKHHSRRPGTAPALRAAIVRTKKTKVIRHGLAGFLEFACFSR
jgi:hypothetical protein